MNATILEHDKPSGIGIFTYNIVNELALIHDDLMVWTIEKKHLQLETNKCVKVLSAISKYLQKSLFLFRTVWDQFVFPFLASKIDCDIIYFPIPEGFLFSSIPQVVTVYDLHPIQFSNEVPFYRNLSFKFRLPYVLRRADAIVTISDNTKRDIVSLLGIVPDKIHVIQCGYDSARFKPVKYVDEILGKYNLRSMKYVLYVGNIVRHKNIISLIKAFKLSNIPVPFVICGSKKDSKYLNEIHATINELGIGDRIILLDYVDVTDLPALYCNATLFAFPSLHEGFGIPLLEAMACGAPILTSNTSSMPDVVGDAAIVVDPNSIKGIAHGIKMIFDDEALRETLRQKGFERVKLFSWKDSALKLEKICSDVVRNRAFNSSG